MTPIIYSTTLGDNRKINLLQRRPKRSIACGEKALSSRYRRMPVNPMDERTDTALRAVPPLTSQDIKAASIMVTAKRTSEAKPSTRRNPAAAADSVEAQLSSFIDKFEPGIADLIRECRAEIRKLLPTAVEIVYDNYNFFVIGYASTERASDCIVSLAAASN